MIRKWLLPSTVGLSIIVIASLGMMKEKSTVSAVPYAAAIYIDGKEATARDHQGYFYNGTSFVPSTLEYEGTVYVPLRLIGSKLNKPVGWSEGKRSVWIGTLPKPALTVQPSPAIAASQPVSLSASTLAGQIPDMEQKSLFGISLGDSLQQVIDTLGQPARQEPSSLGYEWFIYNKNWDSYLQVGIADGKVVDIYSNAPKAAFGKIGIGTSFESLNRKYSFKQLVTFLYEGAQVKISNQLKQRPLALIGDVPVIFYIDQYNQNKVTAIRMIDRLMLIRGGFYETNWTYQGKAPNFDPPALTIKQQELVNAAEERQILDLTNVIRYRNKLPLLRWNEPAAKVARAHSEDMENNQYFDHVSATSGLNPFQRLQQAGIHYQMAGENIAAGYPDGIEAVENWMNSLGHRKNILEKGFTQLGVGVAADYYTQNFVTLQK